MADRRTLPIPIPGPELQRMQASLLPRYGSELWEQAGHRILVIRTPGPEPDIVNDLERAVEYLHPSEVRGLDHCLLVGDRRTTAVSPAPLGRLMDDRITHDHLMAETMRVQIQGRSGHVLHRDKKRLDRIVRLAIRIPKAHARDIDDDDLDMLADEIGPRLATAPYSEIQAVHVLGDEDDVRIDADLLLAEVRRRFEDDDRAVRQEAEEQAAQEAQEAERRRQREEILTVLRRKYEASPASAPAPARPEEIRPRMETSTRPARAAIDAVLQESTTARTVETRPPPSIETVERFLKDAGYDTMRDPPVQGHRIDLAAERSSNPSRIVVRIAEHVDSVVASQLLDACNALRPDLGLVVAPTADDDAQERFVATRAKWIRPDRLDALRL